MGDAIKTGGPAFPVHGGGLLCGEKDDPRNQILQGGMTLRDWFAGQALAGTDFGDWRESDHLERRCYQVADAMLAAREATP